MPPKPPFSEFLEVLRRDGFAITIADRVALQRLLDAETRWDLALLEQRLMYLLASSRDEQARFKLLFREFFSTSREQPTASTSNPKPRSNPNNPYWPLFAASLAALGIILGVIFFAVDIGKRTGPDAQQPDAGQSDAQSPESEYPDAAQPESTDTARIGTEDPDAAQPDAGTATSLTPSPSPGRISPTKASANAGSKLELKSFEIQALERLALSALLAAPLLLGSWFSLRARRRRLFPKLSRPYSFELVYPEPPPTRLDPIALEDLALLLGSSPAQTIVGELDPARTVEATAEHGGAPTLVWAARRSTRRHLVLLSTEPRLRGPRLHFETLLDQLVATGVAIERYDFSGNPCRSFRRGAPDSTFSPSLLLGQFDTLSVFGDPDLALPSEPLEPTAPASLALASWVSELEAFAVRLWLCASPGRCVAPGARALQAHGFSVQSLELAALLELAGGGLTRAERAAPKVQETQVQDAVAFYEHYLGSAFPLLCATTFLPTLSGDGLRYLLGTLGAHVPWNSAARLLGIPWLLDEKWPSGLEPRLRAERQRYPELARRGQALVEQLLLAQRPPAGSAAEAAHDVVLLEHDIRLGKNVEAEFRRLARGSEQARERLRRSPSVGRWLRQHDRHPVQLRRVSQITLALTLLVATLVAALGSSYALTPALTKLLRAKYEREIDVVSGVLALAVNQEARRCWTQLAGDGQTLLDDSQLMLVAIEVGLDRAGTLSAHAADTSSAAPSPDEAWLACLNAPANARSIANPLGRQLFYLANVTLPGRVPTSLPRPTTGPTASPSVVVAVPSSTASSVPSPLNTLPADPCTACLTSAKRVASFGTALRAYGKCENDKMRLACSNVARDALRASMSNATRTPTEKECGERLKRAEAARRLGVSDAASLLRLDTDCRALTAETVGPEAGPTGPDPAEADVRALLAANEPRFRACPANGLVRITFALDEKGVVQDVQVLGRKLPVNPSTEPADALVGPLVRMDARCISDVLNALRFPAPKQRTTFTHVVSGGNSSGAKPVEPEDSKPLEANPPAAAE